EAEDIVLGRFEREGDLVEMVLATRAAHLAQESALAALVTMRIGTATWRDRIHHLRELVRYHHEQEAMHLMDRLRQHPAYARLAGEFATERLRQLAMLQPSVPVYVPQP